MKEGLLNISSREVRFAVLNNGHLTNLSVERKKERQLTGNIYRGEVTNILPNIQSAFIDFGEGDNGFIHISDILENTEKFEKQFDLDFAVDDPKQKEKRKKQQEKTEIEDILKLNQPVLVQVVKEPIGTKGARLTSNLSIAGRYLVLLPNSTHRGVSRKIEDRPTRERLKKLIRSFEMPTDMGLICRTAARQATQDMLVDEAHELLESWDKIIENFKKSNKPTQLYTETDIVKRAVIQAIEKRFDRLLIDDYETFQACKRTYQRYQGEHQLRIEFYRDKVPMFERFNVEKEIEKSVRRKIWLPHGGYIFFERTEAMYTVDVNSGRSTTNIGDVEESLVRINLEAAEEIARQLRIRNVGGLIVIDFIDMRLRKNQRRVLDKLKECMKEDSAKCRILSMSEFGLVEMTRQRSRGSLSQMLFTSCPYCSGRGVVKTYDSISIEIERNLKKAIQHKQQFGIKVVAHPQQLQHMCEDDKEYLTDMADKLNAQVEWDTNDTLHLNDFYFVSTINNEVIEV